ncbi:hypothetical protein [Aequorivita marina]|uniref:hypothetical protein n=1 Tax=Aequorivita marina TaxID=3073654 RepID=UPI002874BAE9|nr:hypothetical protein [Aequorivita sp. S2608]MDS1298401.1 hypothetical protein [Aequorivita sp. S2608]
MKYHISLLFLFCAFLMQAQQESLTKTRFVTGLSVPELIHLGANVDVGKRSQIGASTGFLVFYGYHPTLSVEHRLYFSKLNDFTNRRNWFFRQSGTYLPSIGDEIGSDYQTALSLSIGLDFRSKSRKSGWTLDLGAFIAFPHEDSTGSNSDTVIGPMLRIQYYSYFKKK